MKHIYSKVVIALFVLFAFVLVLKQLGKSETVEPMIAKESSWDAYLPVQQGVGQIDWLLLKSMTKSLLPLLQKESSVSSDFLFQGFQDGGLHSEKLFYTFDLEKLSFCLVGKVADHAKALRYFSDLAYIGDWKVEESENSNRFILLDGAIRIELFSDVYRISIGITEIDELKVYANALDEKSILDIQEKKNQMMLVPELSFLGLDSVYLKMYTDSLQATFIINENLGFSGSATNYVAQFESCKSAFTAVEREKESELFLLLLKWLSKTLGVDFISSSHYWNGFFAIGINGETEVKEVIKSIEFNDDFEEVVVEKIQTAKALDLLLEIGASNPQKLVDEMLKAKILFKDGEDYYFLFSPKLNIQLTDQSLRFRTKGLPFSAPINRNSVSAGGIDWQFRGLHLHLDLHMQEQKSELHFSWSTKAPC